MSLRRNSSLKAPIAALVSLLLLPTAARAEAPTPAAWQFDLKAAYVVLGGQAARATGGIMPSLTGLHLWPLGETTRIGLGADLGIFGLGGLSRWVGVLGGPTATTQVMPFQIPLTFDLTARLDFGRIPVCNAWGLCLRYLGFFPAAEAGAAYRMAEHAAAMVTCGLRIIQTVGWSGVSVEPAAAARVFW